MSSNSDIKKDCNGLPNLEKNVMSKHLLVLVCFDGRNIFRVLLLTILVKNKSEVFNQRSEKTDIFLFSHENHIAESVRFKCSSSVALAKM